MSYQLISAVKRAGPANGGPTPAMDTTPADLFVAHASCYGAVGSMHDLMGNTWQVLTSHAINNQVSVLYYCQSPITSPNHTFSYSGSYPELTVWAFSGSAQNPLSSQNGAVLASGQQLNCGSVTPPVDGCLIVAGGNGSNAATASIGMSGMQQSQSDLYQAGDHLSGISGILIQQVAAAIDPQLTCSSGTGPLAASVAVFLPGTGGGGSQNVVPVSNANWFFSPYNWFVSGGDFARSNNPGAYCKTVFGGASVKLHVDVSALVSAGVDPTQYPAFAYSIDGKALVRRQLTSTDAVIALANGLTAGSHTLEIVFVAAWWQADRWNTPVQALKITGLELDTGQALTAPSLQPGRMLLFMDSEGEGYEVLAQGVSVANQDASLAFPLLLGRALNCEIGVVAFAGQGWGAAGGGNVPRLIDTANPQNGAWCSLDSTHSRLNNDGLLSPQPDLVVCCHGQNDGVSPQVAVTQAIGEWRAAAPNARIVCGSPANLSQGDAISAGVSAATDPKASYVSSGENLLASGRWCNGTHLSRDGQARYAAILSALVEWAIQ